MLQYLKQVPANRGRAHLQVWEASYASSENGAELKTSGDSLYVLLDDYQTIR